MSPQSVTYFPVRRSSSRRDSVLIGLVLFLFVAVRFDLSHKPSVALHPKTPEMAPPGQIHIPNPEKGDPEA